MWPFSKIRRLEAQIDRAHARIACLETDLRRSRDLAAYWRGETNRLTQAPPRQRPDRGVEERREAIEERDRRAARPAFNSDLSPLPITHPMHPLNPANPLAPLIDPSAGGWVGRGSTVRSCVSDAGSETTCSDGGSCGGGGCD